MRTRTHQVDAHMMEGTSAEAMADAHMEELVERSEVAEDGGAQLYHDGSLLAPEVDFIIGQYRITRVLPNRYVRFNCIKTKLFLKLL